MKTKSYRLNIAPRHAKGFSAYAQARKVIPPKVKVDNASEGKFTISTTKNTTLGKYQLELKEKGHLPISINLEVIPEEKD